MNTDSVHRAGGVSGEGPAGGKRSEPLGVAVAGLGRSGWNIHAKTIREMGRLFRMVGAMDPDPERRAEAVERFGCAACGSYEELLALDGVDVVVVASPSHLHCEHTVTALESGRHVVCEKPFALNALEAERMLGTGESRGLVLAPFQNRRYEPHYLKVLELVREGALGEVLQIRMCWHQFTRRWDWQAMRRYGGGALYNNGTHLLDQALQFIGDEAPEVFVDVRRGLSQGDADEHMKLVLRGESGPTVDIELTGSCAYEHERWHVMATAGGLRGTPDRLEWRTVDWSLMPPRPVLEGPAPGRRYPREEIVWTEHAWEPPADATTPYVLFYTELYDAVRNGRPMLVTPESALRYVRVLDECRARLEAASA